MITALVLSTALAGVDSLDKVKLNGLTFKAPVEWKKSSEDNSLSWSAPEGDAEFAVSVFPVDPMRPAKSCVDQLVAALSGPPPAAEGADAGAAAPAPAAGSFDRLFLGAQPAAKKVTTDFVGEGEKAKVDENKVTTTTVVGCDGKTKWVMTYSSKTRLATRFGPILKRILESVGYGK